MSAGRPLSLLWPEGLRGAPAARLDDQAIADLHLDEIVRAIVGAGAPAGRLATRERFAHDVLTTLITEPDIIAYRQAVLTDLIDNPRLRERLERALPALEALGDVHRGERGPAWVAVATPRRQRRQSRPDAAAAGGKRPARSAQRTGARPPPPAGPGRRTGACRPGALHPCFDGYRQSTRRRVGAVAR